VGKILVRSDKTGDFEPVNQIRLLDNGDQIYSSDGAIVRGIGSVDDNPGWSLPVPRYKCKERNVPCCSPKEIQDAQKTGKCPFFTFSDGEDTHCFFGEKNSNTEVE